MHESPAHIHVATKPKRWRQKRPAANKAAIPKALRDKLDAHTMATMKVVCESDVAMANKKTLDLKLRQEKSKIQYLDAKRENLRAKREYEQAKNVGRDKQRLEFGAAFSALKPPQVLRMASAKRGGTA